MAQHKLNVPYPIKKMIKSLMHNFSMRTGFGTGTVFRPYSYMFLPQQLIFLCDCIKQTKNVPGCYVEAGCAYGDTTIFLKKFMQGENIQKPYFALDTFSGFTAEHASYEIENRAKPKSLANIFSDNKKDWFDFKLKISAIQGVKSIQSDVTAFNFKTIAPIAFCLLDVDLYLPIKDVLPKIYDALSSGGIIVVDDCQPHDLWDGALQAYMEFIKSRNLPQDIVFDKLGIIRK